MKVLLGIYYKDLRYCTRKQKAEKKILFPAIFYCLLIFSVAGKAQTTIKYDYFSRKPLGELPVVLPATPQVFQFTPVTIQQYNRATKNIAAPNPFADLNFSDKQIQQQNEAQLKAIEQRQSNALNEIYRELQEEKIYKAQLEWSKKTMTYRDAFNALMKFNPDSFSLSKAIFLVENAYFDGKMKYDRFLAGLKFRADLVKQILKREKLDVKENMALNYGIQKLYQQSNSYYNSKTKQTITLKPFKYDFEDFRGEKEYFKMFTSKMMTTNSGQCHSMPLLYLLIAEQLGAKAWLSLAPEHSFIQFPDKNGNLLNFEATNGHLVSSNWLLKSGFINANALKSKTYLDTLSQRKLFAQCLADLLLGYMHKFGYDDYAENMRRIILKVNPSNLTAMIIDANIKTQVALQAINAAGRPKEAELSNYPEAYQAYLAMHSAYESIDALGYQDMPKEAYQKWLKTIEQEKKKQDNLRLKEQMQQEMQLLKKRKSIVVDRTKD